MSGIGSAISGTAKATTAVVGAGVTAFAGLSKAALDSCASLEQNIGGIETLFGAGGKSIAEYADSVGKSVEEVKDEYDSLMRAQETMLANADKAYLSAGMSSNAYMETVTGFSAALIQSLNGDTEAAATKANQAIIDMSDNANKMGSDITSIQNAYQGFAKQNYTMLDNLKLGYGGTKEEMQRLLEDAQAISGIEYDISSYADVVDAIHVIQKEMGIAGTTADEAAKTVEGSMAAARAAYENFLAGTGDADQLADAIAVAAGNITNNLVEIVPRLADGLKEVVEGLTPQIGPLVESLLPAFVTGAISLTNGLVSALPGVLSALSAVIPDIITAIAQSMPLLLAAGMQILQMLLSGIQQNLPLIMESASQMATQLTSGFMTMLPQILQIGFQILEQLAQGITQALPTLLPTITEILLQICMMLVENIPLLVESATLLIVGLATGLIEALPVLIEMAPEIIVALVDALIASAPMILDAAGEICTMLQALLQQAWDWVSEYCAKTLPGLMEDVGQWFSELPEKIAYWLGFAIGKITSWALDLKDKAKEAVDGFVEKAVECVKNLPENMAEWLDEVVNNKIPEFKDNLIETMEQLPEKILEIGGNIVQSLWDGISGGWDWLTGKVSELTDSLIGGITDGLGLTNSKAETGTQTSVTGFDETGAFANANGTMKRITEGASALTAGVGVSSNSQFESVTRVYLEGDSEGLFNVVRTENEVFRKSTGENAW